MVTATARIYTKELTSCLHCPAVSPVCRGEYRYYICLKMLNTIPNPMQFPEWCPLQKEDENSKLRHALHRIIRDPNVNSLNAAVCVAQEVLKEGVEEMKPLHKYFITYLDEKGNKVSTVS